MSYFRAARRFWWIVVLGVLAAGITGLALLYKVDTFVPPHLVQRAKTTHVATTELLVDSPSDPYLRVAITTQVPPGRAQSAKTKTSATKPPLTTESSVDTKTLIDAANLFPLFVKSDAVLAIRRRLVGEIPGVVEAKALYATQGLNRFRPSKIPVIQITAVSPKPKQAIALAEGTANAFELWLRQKQVGTKIPPAQRIVIRELHAADSTTAKGGPSYSLVVLAGLGVLALFLAAAVLLDQQLPAGRVARQEDPDTTGESRDEGVAGGYSASATTAEPQP
jgi:hypothetical protein